MTSRLGLVGISLMLLVACSADQVIDDHGLGSPKVVVMGYVRLSPSMPVAGASVLLRVWDTIGVEHATATPQTDAAGRFATTLLIDSVLGKGFLQADIQPPLGSGMSRGFAFDTLRLDATGDADAIDLDVTVIQLTDPVPAGVPGPLSAAVLVGDYSGQTVPPETFAGVAYLDLSLTPVADSVYGRYDIDFSASTACGDGNGDVTGEVRNDTLFLRLVSDSFPGWDGTIKVNTFIATTYTVSADTLILHYPPSSGPCPWGSPAPLRLVRQ